MRCRIGLSVVALASGVLISQGVAYLCAARAGDGISALVMASPEQPLWPGFLRGFCPAPDVGALGADLGIGHSFTLRESPLPAPPDFKDNPPKFRLLTESFGWPARSVVIYEAMLITGGGNAGAIDEPGFYRELQERAGLGCGVPTPAWMPQVGRLRSAIPVLPIWSGLAMNTGLYGVLTLASIIVPGSLRRLRRRRRGACVRCGYPLAGLALCPECGPVTEAASAGSQR